MNRSSGDSTPTPAWKGIFFDVGGTLLYPDPATIGEVAGAVLGTAFSPADLLAAVQFGSVTIDEAMAAGQPIGTWWPLYIGGVLRHLGFSFQAGDPPLEECVRRLRERHRQRNLWSFLLPGTHQVLEQLTSEGYLLGVISNSDGQVRQQLIEAGLAPFFRFILDSHYVGHEKPDPAIFRLALRAARLQPAEVLYIGDIVHIDAHGARGVGMGALILDPLDRRANLWTTRLPDLTRLPDWLASSSSRS
ncbi:MAG: hypothetical protein OZSIB_3891 [Candidatus Ozemobacter sibiricus]|jgi:putative hydrolase of the HAD superfamily|uniref:HAD family hydrolase n=1 Tax=Candidatus Ozemobacter sibiricus TaxID=2268124 RepID=A0A367ZRL1_9BACT|nr:MAG: hypothetical protein OZSIB_3891 [Candidatus Ozemobacter sibiricus]